MFKKEMLVRLRNTNNINGILLIKNNSQDYPLKYSPEDQCPNRYSSYKKCNISKPWNQFGSALLIEDWPFPMFYTEVRFQILCNINQTKIYCNLHY
jgi:nicastrin